MALRSSLPALLYHHVGAQQPGTYPSLTVARDQFRRHIGWLARRGFRSLTVEDVIRWTVDRRAPRGRAVLITFDDAYADLAQWAFPVLLQARLSGLVFVVTDLIGKTNRWDAALGGEHAILTADEICQWSEQGIEFGAHGRSHADLTQLSESEAREEMAGSKADLEAIIGAPVRSFAYPYGEFDDATTSVAASIFEVAFTAESGTNTRWTDPHRIRRSMVWRRDRAPEVELRALLGFSPHERVRGWVSAKRRALRAALPRPAGPT